MEANEKYRGLRIIAKIAIIVAWIVLILGVIAALAAFFGINDAYFRWVGFFGLPFALSSFFWLYVAGKLVYVLTDVEANTRGGGAGASGDVVAALKDQQAVNQKLDEAIQNQSSAIAELSNTIAGLQAALAPPPAEPEEEPEAPAEEEEPAEAGDEAEAPEETEEPAEADEAEAPAEEEDAGDAGS